MICFSSCCKELAEILLCQLSPEVIVPRMHVIIVVVVDIFICNNEETWKMSGKTVVCL